ncbi:hypothetical protein [Bdellovibrio sp. KM01]|uniref:hypothetical protein n=1 Tax=Bdellovibrio sp. KM01 TaxID=2748865 RepID=UPI0015E9411D|nr:hypothetical protein [Bdellovibrio sp. KM01]QLY25759.1 hypothetical protein HW988_01535 [Bdellovibrio sp. KM01]
MKNVFLGLLLLLPVSAFAGNYNIECTAQVYESFSDGSSRQNKVPMAVEVENAAHIVLSADLEERAFILNGPKEGPFRISIIEAPNYTKGSVSTADFSKDGRLQLSTVNGPLIYKLECFKN